MDKVLLILPKPVGFNRLQLLDRELIPWLLLLATEFPTYGEVLFLGGCGSQQISHL